MGIIFFSSLLRNSKFKTDGGNQKWEPLVIKYSFHGAGGPRPSGDRVSWDASSPNQDKKKKKLRQAFLGDLIETHQSCSQL